ncbi:DUF6262 family protein [Enterococcus malodoratus]|uniref:Transposase n=1 Tax=Enterococcus malodoratus ATCC 43197 TaxID=1158601 RepID=R2PI67_9ENTE|nr:DUF6262 family protein [Enterococcus malodoratus]EOH82898.1 hypothetical protein UAI_00016 [Enterococcus malodoratus ATCC 43197]EOT63200.1 hypothetical protein I585_04554 [Enterococcus malodoratus ATCC 43197]SPX03953.1 Uncharacterised protein [Enterococcus malodoratus]STD70859.1 Uncharacterised protein [Enterococcus malodoratus]
MDNYNQIEHLKRVHEDRKAATAKKVDHAINALIAQQKKINFNSVAKEAGVAKATLYSNNAYRSRIETLRITSDNQKRFSGKSLDNSSNSKDALIESLKRKNKKLEIENGRLRNDLKVAYGQIYQRN